MKIGEWFNSLSMFRQGTVLWLLALFIGIPYAAVTEGTEVALFWFVVLVGIATYHIGKKIGKAEK